MPPFPILEHPQSLERGHDVVRVDRRVRRYVLDRNLFACRDKMNAMSMALTASEAPIQLSCRVAWYFFFKAAAYLIPM